MGGSIAGLVLAGGRSRRMGGGDKALLPLAGRPLLAHAVERLRPQVGALALSANGDPAAYSRFGLPILADPLPGHAGPLAGLLAGLEWAAAAGFGALATAACDTPFFPRDLVGRLAEGALARPGAIALPVSAGRRHLVFGLWPVDLAKELAKDLAKDSAKDLAAGLATPGDRSVRGFVADRAVVEIAFTAEPSGPDPFFNINTPDELAEAEAWAAA